MADDDRKSEKGASWYVSRLRQRRSSWWFYGIAVFQDLNYRRSPCQAQWRGFSVPQIRWFYRAARALYWEFFLWVAVWPDIFDRWPCFALPPALSPSTMKISEIVGSFPGNPRVFREVMHSSAPFLMIASLAAFAASRTLAARNTLSMILWASAGFSSKKVSRPSFYLQIGQMVVLPHFRVFLLSALQIANTQTAFLCTQLRSVLLEYPSPLCCPSADFWPPFFGIIIDCTGERHAKPGQMCSTFYGMDDVDIRLDVFGKAIVVRSVASKEISPSSDVFCMAMGLWTMTLFRLSALTSREVIPPSK